MPIVAVIPVRSFGLGKKRLATALTDSHRRSLGIALADRIGSTAERVGLIPLYVTAEPEVAGWATTAGFPSIPERGTGLDAAAQAGVDWATTSGSPWLVLHADLPLITTGDLRTLHDHIERGREVIAPSADGGTSALGASRQIEFAYGPGSFHRHLSRLDRPVIVARIGLLHDVDSRRDLASARSHPRGQWVDALLP